MQRPRSGLDRKPPVRIVQAEAVLAGPRPGVTITVDEITCQNIKPKVLLVKGRCSNRERQSASLAGTFRREDRAPNNSHAIIYNAPRSIAANHMAPGISVKTY